MIRFLCGCESKIEIPVIISDDDLEFVDDHGDYEERREQEIHKYLATFSAIGHDEEGFIVCASHRARRYGWRSVPYQSTRMPVPMAHWTPLEYEHYLIYGKIPPARVSPQRRVFPRDRRDNRDPQIIGREILDNAAAG